MTDISELRGADRPELLSGGILRRGVVAEMAEATDIVGAARAEADAIRQSMADTVAEEQARGFAEGRAEAEREAAAALVAETATLDAALAGLEGELAALVAQSVRQIVGELGADDLVRRTVARALSTVRSERRATLYVAASAVAAARDAVATAIAEYPALEMVDVAEDATLSGVDHRLESDLGVVHFVLDDTLDDLASVLTARK